MDKIINFAVLSLMILLGSCSSKQFAPLDFMTIFNVYKFTGNDHIEERYAKIMKFMENFNLEESYSGTEYNTNEPYAFRPTCYRYVAKCDGVAFEDFEFKPLSDKHFGIAYVGKVDNPKDTSACVYDYMKFYFPDTLSARLFLDDGVRHGFERVDCKPWEEHLGEDPYSDPVQDSINLVAMQYSTWYYDREYKVFYGLRLCAEKDKNMVILHWGY